MRKTNCSKLLKEYSRCELYLQHLLCLCVFTPTANLKEPVNLLCMSFGCWRKPEHPEETNAGTGRKDRKDPVGQQV